jgi:hypothetical protein
MVVAQMLLGIAIICGLTVHLVVAERRHLARAREFVRSWAESNQVSFELDDADIRRDGPGGRYFILLGTDTTGARRFYKFEVHSSWRAGWLQKPAFLMSESLTERNGAEGGLSQ